MFWNHCCARLQMRTALTETCVYHIRHSCIGPELRRQAIHSSSNICRVVLSVEARLHCQLLVWRENNVSAEVANVGESCMQRSANISVWWIVLIAARLNQIQIHPTFLYVFLTHFYLIMYIAMDVFLTHFYLIMYIAMDVFLMHFYLVMYIAMDVFLTHFYLIMYEAMDVFLIHLPPFMSSSFAELCSPSPGIAWGSSTASSSAGGSAFTTASKHTARVKAA